MVWEREKWFLSSMDLLVTDKESQFQNAISICKLRYDARSKELRVIEIYVWKPATL